MSEIIELIEKNDVQGVRALLERDPTAAAARDEHGLSALTRAAYTNPELVAAVRAADPPLDAWDTILIGEADPLPAPDEWSPDGFTPLHLAAYAGNAEAARRLLERGADPNLVARASFARVTPLGTAAFAGSVEVARLLLDNGADANASGEGGGGPLHTAAQNGNRELVELLLEHGADPSAATDAGQTPRDLAPSDEIRALLER